MDGRCPEISETCLFSEAVPAFGMKAAQLLLEHCDEFPTPRNNNIPEWSNVYDDPPYEVQVCRLPFDQYSVLPARTQAAMCQMIKDSMMQYPMQSLEDLEEWVGLRMEHDLVKRETWLLLELHDEHTAPFR